MLSIINYNPFIYQLLFLLGMLACVVFQFINFKIFLFLLGTDKYFAELLVGSELKLHQRHTQNNGGRK